MLPPQHQAPFSRATQSQPHPIAPRHQASPVGQPLPHLEDGVHDRDIADDDRNVQWGGPWHKILVTYVRLAVCSQVPEEMSQKYSCNWVGPTPAAADRERAHLIGRPHVAVAAAQAPAAPAHPAPTGLDHDGGPTPQQRLHGLQVAGHHCKVKCGEPAKGPLVDEPAGWGGQERAGRRLATLEIFCHGVKAILDKGTTGQLGPASAGACALAWGLRPLSRLWLSPAGLHLDVLHHHITQRAEPVPRRHLQRRATEQVRH